MVAPVASSFFSLSPAAAGTSSVRRESRNSADSPDSQDPTTAADPTAPRATDGQSLSERDRQTVETLQARDREVRAHEAAHLAAAAGLALGGASFTYARGPDGRSYATGGEVNIDVSPVPDNPEATIAKAQQIRSAALAPARPSGQDRAVAAEAVQMETEARQEMARLASSYGANGLSQRQGSLLDLLA